MPHTKGTRATETKEKTRRRTQLDSLGRSNKEKIKNNLGYGEVWKKNFAVLKIMRNIISMFLQEDIKIDLQKEYRY